MRFIKNKILYSLFCLFLGGGSLTAQNLTVCSVEFPDTVIIGETATLAGYVLNNDDVAYTDDIIVNIDIEDIAPDGILNDGEINESITINQSNLAPNDSVYFEKELSINPEEFGVASVDLVVAWPQVSANDGVVDDEADIQLTYVRDDEAEVNDNEHSYDYLPAAVKDYIQENYPDASIDNITMVQCKFKVELDNGVELIFSLEGILYNVEKSKQHNYDNYEDEDKDFSDDDDESNVHDDHRDFSDDDDEGNAYNDDRDFSDDDDESNAYEGDRDFSDDDDEGNAYNDDDEEAKADDDNVNDNNYFDFWNDNFWNLDFWNYVFENPDFWNDDFWNDYYEDEKDNDDNGGKTNDDDDDLFGNDFWNREKEIYPFKITVSNQVIQVIADDEYRITELILYGLNGKTYHRTSNKNNLSEQKILTHNLAPQLTVLRIFLTGNEGDSIEFNRKIMLRF